MNSQDYSAEKELLLSLKNGNNAALSELYNLHVQQLYLFVLKTAKSPDLAEDIIHDVFIKLWESRSSIEHTKPLKPYLYTIARRHLLNLLKRASHESKIVEEIRIHTSISEDTTALQTEYNESNNLIHEALNQLAPRAREVFMRCKLEGFSYKQVADQMNITEGTVNSQVVKATKSIRRFLSLREMIIIVILYLV